MVFDGRHYLIFRLQRNNVPTSIVVRVAVGLLETRRGRRDQTPPGAVRLHGPGVDLPAPAALRQHLAASCDIPVDVLSQTEHDQGDASLLASRSPEL